MSVKSECGTVRVCIGCLETDGKLFDIRQKHLEEIFAELTGLIVYGGLLCSVCLQLLRKFSAFRVRCVNACHIMQQSQPLNQDVLSNIDRTHLKLNLVKSRMLFYSCISLENQNKAKYCKLDKTATLLVNISAENCVTIPCYNEETTTDTVFSIKYKNPVKSDSHQMNETCFKKEIHFDYPIISTPFAVKNEMIHHIDEFDDTKNVKLNNDVDNINNESSVMNTDILLDTKDKNLKVESQSSETVCAESVNNESLIEDDDDDDGIDDLVEEKVKKSDKGLKKVSSEEKSLVHETSKLFNAIWTRVSREDGDFYKLFERLYKESLNKDRTVCTKNDRKRKIHKRCEIENLISFLSLYRQVADLHNVSIEFMSIAEQRRSMEEKRRDATEEQQCKLCCKNFRSAPTYDRHMKLMHDESLPYKCQVCLYTFKKRPCFVLHLFKMHAVRRTCKDCGLLIVASTLKTQWDEIREHVQSVHRKTLVQCQFCGRGFTAPKFYYSHIRDAHRAVMDAVQCWLCGDSYNGLKGIRGHMRRIHSGALQCGVCSVWFVDGATMETHKRGGECDKELSGCPLCGATFATEPLLKEHYNDLHAKYKCEKCDQVFIELKSYKQHYYKVCNESRERLPRALSSAEPRPRPAPSAGKSGNVTNKKYHYNKNSHMCDICGKSFDFPANLRYHQRLHTGEKPYKCKYCDKTFRMAPSLLTHMWTHTGERRYKCQLCPKAFRQSSHLQSHMPSHTHEKRHACSMCAKRFTSGGSLRHHVRTAHEGHPPARKERRRRALDPTCTQ